MGIRDWSSDVCSSGRRWVDADTDPALGGDEPVLIAYRTGAKVRADANRAAAARALVEAGCDIVVCDDGLQHYRLRRDIEIEVIDGRRRYGNGQLLRSEEHTSELQSLMRTSYAVFCLKKKKQT